MALFGKKKQDLPDFSAIQGEETLPNKELEFPKFPVPPQQQMPQQRPIPEFRPMQQYPEEQGFDVPQRKKLFSRPQVPQQPQPVYREPVYQETPYREPVFRQEPHTEFRESLLHVKTSKPVFIKIESYREAVEALEKIRERLRDSNQLLQELIQIREEEDRELEAWKQDLDNIKNKLLEIDRLLFEQE